ncbi:Crn1 protein [Phytophthora nicotianae]|uniref:Crn1 protein n=1 Tax=Phytophthora nicotianae TaxID=4792 RepID=A0A0W8DM34_PHYNI|nr:Crn1 protein [Phytophthora nicotianae]
MGKRSRNGRGGGRGGGRGRGNKKPRADGKPEDWRADRFADWVYENDNFDALGRIQKALGTPLPTTFRINSSCPFADRIREHIEQDFKFDGLVVDDEPEPISCMPWYPDNAALRATATNATEAQKPDEASTNETKPRRSRRNDKKGEVYVPFGADNWATVREYYDISPAFSAEQLITRSEDAKSVTFVTESITMALLEEMKRKKLKVVYAGLKMFERNETAEGGKVYRVCQAGLPHILPFMNKRKAKVSTKDFQMMLERLGDLLDFDEFEPATRQYFENAPIGSVVCMLDRPGQSNVESKVMNLVVWRGRNSVNVMAAKADVAVLLGTMKELKIYNSAVQEAVMEAKKVKDEERAARDEKKEVEIEEVKDEGKKTNATPPTNQGTAIR